LWWIAILFLAAIQVALTVGALYVVFLAIRGEEPWFAALAAVVCGFGLRHFITKVTKGTFHGDY